MEEKQDESKRSIKDVEVAEEEEEDHAMDEDKFAASIVPDTDDPTMPSFT